MIHFYLNSYTTPARSFAQKLLHRICYTGVQLTSRWSNCIWTPAKSDFSSSSISLWRQGQPGGGLRTVTLCGVSDTQTCGEMRVLFVLGQPSVEIARVGWANMWCGERLRPQQPSAEIVRFRRPNMWWNVNFFWARATLYRDRAGRTSKHVAKCKFGEARRSPFARNEGQPSKTGVILWLKVEMQAWHESQMAITVGKLWFFNARCKRSRIGVNLRVYPFWNVRHNCFARNKTCVKLRFYKVRRKPFTQNDCPRSKFAIFQRRMQPFRTIWWPNVKNLS